MYIQSHSSFLDNNLFSDSSPNLTAIMKVIIALLFVATLVAAQRDIEVVKQDFDNDGLGSFSHNLELNNGAKISGQGQLKSVGNESPVAHSGSFSFVGEDGQTYTVTYIADENGYQPQGAHLPRTK